MLTTLILLSCAFILTHAQRSPLVRLNEGILQGKKIFTDSSRNIDVFLGVPYARAPLRNLRFEPPQKHLGWNGTYQAENFDLRCPQLPLSFGVNDNEDCLYLNVWSPESSGVYAPFPVLVFLDGVDFAKSSDVAVSGEDLAAEGIVVVTINYRLNVFGFFCLGTPEARGNLGLLDQYFALRWIKNNIRQFGGDPGKITLHGHFSGADSVAYHMASPRASGLFQRAIMTSGSVFARWHVRNDPIKASKNVLRLLGCDTKDPLGCVRAKSVVHVLQAYQEYLDTPKWGDDFFPVVDIFLAEQHRYFPVDPMRILSDGSFPQVPILTGLSKPNTNTLYAQWVEIASQGSTQLQQYVEKAKIPEVLRRYRFSSLSWEEISELVRWKYFLPTKGETRTILEQLKRLEYEAMYEAPYFLQINSMAFSYMQPIYAYVFDDAEETFANVSDPSLTTDVMLLFSPNLNLRASKKRLSERQFHLSMQLKQFWTNFISFGNPSPNNRVNPWRKYTSSDPYIEPIGQSRFSNNQERDDRLYFWNQMLPKLSDLKLKIASGIPRELQISPDPAAGFRNAMYTLVALVIALLILLVICIILLKKRYKERDRHLHMIY